MAPRFVGVLLILVAHTLSACGDEPLSHEEAVAALVEAWNTTDDFVDVQALVRTLDIPESARRSVLVDAYPELMTGCGPGILGLHSPDETWTLLRARRADNGECKTYVNRSGMHTSGLVDARVCDFRGAAAGVPALEWSEAFQDVVVSDPDALRPWIDAHCAGVPEDSRQRFPEGGACQAAWDSVFRCEIGLACAPYEVEEPNFGICRPCDLSADPYCEDVLSAAIEGRYAYQGTSSRSTRWPWELYEILYAESDAPMPWDAYWTHVLQHVALSVKWSTDDLQVELFRGRVTEHDLLENGGLLMVHASTGDEGETWSCLETRPVVGLDFDEDGNPADLRAFVDTITEGCTRDDTLTQLPSFSVCPGVEGSVFQCAERSCDAVGEYWIGGCF